MIIKVLNLKYTVGCKRGYDHIQKPNLLLMLNSIIEWDFCEFPKEETGQDENGEPVYEENRKYLGEEPELVPGNVFEVDGQVIAINDEESLALVNTDTGGRGLRRVWDEIIDPELDLVWSGLPEVEVEDWEETKKEDIPDSYETGNLEYKKYKIWKDHFVEGRLEANEDLCVKCEISGEDFLFPVTVYMMNWSFKYNPEDFMDENHAKDTVQQIISWFYSEVPRKEKRGDN